MDKKKDKRMVILGVCLVLFVLLTIATFTGLIKPIDEGMQSFILKIRNDHLTDIFTIVTNLGGAYALLAITTLLVLIKRNKKTSLFIAINLVVVFLISQIFKFIFRRSRPAEIFLVSASGYSYPSGHMMVSSAFYFYILYLIWITIKNKMIKIILTIMTTVLILLIGFSRIYLGVHYTTDVFGGLLLAIAYLILFIRITTHEKMIEDSKK